MVKFFRSQESRNAGKQHQAGDAGRFKPKGCGIRLVRLPGWWVSREGKIIVAMPGPPAEMQFMWQTAGGPKIRKISPGVILFQSREDFRRVRGRSHRVAQHFHCLS